MSEVLCVYQIPIEQGNEPEALEKVIRETVPGKYKIQKGSEIVPLFFGLKALKLQFIIPEEDGSQDELEEFLNELELVGGEISLDFITKL
ncbi:MAG: elongation factor 1-beta [Candidatus Heimdallarchaeota archaeon]|nr:elongation factor 1-beta [Candidatus Heimdallarchaeota archaeon]MCK5048329.1 elongation factor 1-beta [Candidatus Heimdallarchaeota archaeon]